MDSGEGVRVGRVKLDLYLTSQSASHIREGTENLQPPGLSSNTHVETVP